MLTLVDIDWEDMQAWFLCVEGRVSYEVDRLGVAYECVVSIEQCLYSVDLLLDIDDVDVRNELWRMREVAMSYERVCRAGREFYRCLDEYCEMENHDRNDD